MPDVSGRLRIRANNTYVLDAGEVGTSYCISFDLTDAREHIDDSLETLALFVDKLFILLFCLLLQKLPVRYTVRRDFRVLELSAVEELHSLTFALLGGC